MPEALHRALLVGINHYDNMPALTGCINDVEALAAVLARHEDASPNFDCIARQTATQDSLSADVSSLVSPGADLALLYFAGHGAQHDRDVSLCTTDGTRHNPGVRLSQVLGNVAGSPVREVVIILDCCFSGAAGGVPQLGSDSAVLRQGVSILAASRGDQPSAERQHRGVFSRYVEAALDGGAADVVGKVTVAGVYAYLSELFGPWDQRPTFKANVDRLHELRRCRPAVPVAELRQLREVFPTYDYNLPLDPSYEPDAQPSNSEHEAVFGVLQRARAAKLVEPVGHEHMYYAAMRSLSCRLTPLGQHYWRLADLNRL